MSKKICYIIFVLLLSMSFINCATLLGVKEPFDIKNSQIESFNKKFGITNYYKIDKDKFLSIYKNLNEKNINDLLQPIQLIVFDKKGNNLCHLINCNIGGIPLKWNRYQSFDSIPILPKDFRQPFYKVTIDQVKTYLTPILSDNELENINSSVEYIYIVKYSIFLGSFSKSFLKYVHRNISLDPQKVKVIYVNCDNFFYNLSQEN